MNGSRAREIVASVNKSPAGASFNSVHMAEYDKARGYLTALEGPEAAELTEALAGVRLYLGGDDAARYGHKGIVEGIDAALANFKAALTNGKEG